MVGTLVSRLASLIAKSTKVDQGERVLLQGSLNVLLKEGVCSLACRLQLGTPLLQFVVQDRFQQAWAAHSVGQHEAQKIPLDTYSSTTCELKLALQLF